MKYKPIKNLTKQRAATRATLAPHPAPHSVTLWCTAMCRSGLLVTLSLTRSPTAQCDILKCSLY